MEYSASPHEQHIPPLIAEHIVLTPGTCGCKPRIAGHRIRVQDVAIWHERLGYSVDEIIAYYPHRAHYSGTSAHLGCHGARRDAEPRGISLKAVRRLLWIEDTRYIYNLGKTRHLAILKAWRTRKDTAYFVGYFHPNLAKMVSDVFRDCPSSGRLVPRHHVRQSRHRLCYQILQELAHLTRVEYPHTCMIGSAGSTPPQRCG